MAETTVKGGVLQNILGRNKNVPMGDEKPRYEEVRKNAVEALTKLFASLREEKDNGLKTLETHVQGIEKKLSDFHSEFQAVRKSFEDAAKQTESRVNDAVAKMEKRIEKERDFIMADLSNIIAEAYDTAQSKPAKSKK